MIVFMVSLSAEARPNPGEAVFQADDTDGNGLISGEEWHAAAQKRFELLDTNKDGQISKEEMDDAKGTMKARFKSLRSGE
jgi:Ca2+-binding EF-hand superfamily protein